MKAKRRAFVEYYLKWWNASKAARLAGYSQKTSNVAGSKLLTYPDVKAAIEARLTELVASADEVKARLTEHARSDMGDFITVDEDAGTWHISIAKARLAGVTHLIKRIRRTADGVSIELYSAQDALVTLAKVHKLVTEKHEISGLNGGPIPVEVLPVDYRNGLDALAPGPMADSEASGQNKNFEHG